MRAVKGYVPYSSGLHIFHVYGTEASPSKMVISDGTRMMKFWGGGKNNFALWTNVSGLKKPYQNVKLCVAGFG